MNNTISQTAMGMTPQQIRNTNVSADGFIDNSINGHYRRKHFSTH